MMIDYDPTVHMQGLTPFNIKDKDDELNVAHYIRGMCQHLSHKEVREVPFECPHLFLKKLKVSETYMVFALFLFACGFAAAISSRAIC